ncbi:hypothetical protein [Streptomyces chrestomyceticus]|uniref:hypothetical protein n=1 Tax=Streptomyces chrestomyceticus TaxID=68185 RepID=UPI0033C90634
MTTTVLTAVLQAHAGRCACPGTCGKEHPGKQCGATHSGEDQPLLAAPQTPHATDAQNAAAPVETLRPWCWTCWRQALAAVRTRAAEQRRQQMEEMQIGLFDVA